MGSGCNPQKENHCATMLSSDCVKYTGPAVSALEICPGDTVTETIQALLKKLLEVSIGQGISIDGVSLKDCPFLLNKYPALKKNLEDLLQLLVISTCELAGDIAALKKILAGSGNSVSYDLKCLPVVQGEATTEKVVQHVINFLCQLNTRVAEIITNAGNTTIISSIVNKAIKGLITTPGGNGFSLQEKDGLFSYSLHAFVPPGAMLPYIGTLSHFDSSGKGLAGTPMQGWYLCNGQNGTPDMRGFVPVGILQGAGGQAVEPVVDPVGNKDPSMNYAMGQSGGKAKVILDVNQLPAHTHPVTDPGHVHDYSFPNPDSFSGSKFNAAKTDNPSARQTGKAFTGIQVGSAGGNGAHENRMPYRACAFIIRFD